MKTDTVAVVRCRDCRRSRSMTAEEQKYFIAGTLICEYETYSIGPEKPELHRLHQVVGPAHFCSCGSRRKGGK